MIDQKQILAFAQFWTLFLVYPTLHLILTLQHRAKF